MTVMNFVASRLHQRSSRCVSVPSVSQETRIRATEKDADSKAQNICISNHYGGEEVTHTLATDGGEDTHGWMEAFWQHFYDMSKSRTLTYARVSWRIMPNPHCCVDIQWSQGFTVTFRPVEAVLR